MNRLYKVVPPESLGGYDEHILVAADDPLLACQLANEQLGEPQMEWHQQMISDNSHWLAMGMPLERDIQGLPRAVSYDLCSYTYFSAIEK